jgi:putative transposase
LALATKYRHAVFAGRHLVRLEEIMRDVCADFEMELAESNGESNLVLLLVNFPPKLALSKLVNSLKGVPSRRMPAGVPRPAPPLLKGEPAVVQLVLRLVGRRSPVPVLRQYIQQQNRPG